MIARILPAAVAAVESFGDPDTPVVLFPQEEAALGYSVAKRRNEFTTARWCARAALARLGLPAVPIVPGERGAPVWPDGVVGSITHCDGYRACALAHEGEVRTLGVDAEPNAALPAGVLDAVAAHAERNHLRRLAKDGPGVSWDRLLFSAKESVYKAWFPLTRRFLDFAEADVRPAVDGTFTARLLVDPPLVDGRALTGFDGRWIASDGLLLTSIVIERPIR
ncbi:4'-phosphopantetheinyl transferase [Nocardia sp. NPDC052566]|uniref:4'-phosphopantetheinyl transferase n=1 Tax=Nocardia sp. NPDC052566 TaxID=3364330 RepID=UPI0037CB330F